MVNERRRDRSGGDELQDVVVSRLLAEGNGTVSDARSVRVFDYRAFRFHYLHVSNGTTEKAGCRVCSKGLEGTMAETEASRRMEEARVAESDRSDEEGSTSSPRSGWVV